MLRPFLMVLAITLSGAVVHAQDAQPAAAPATAQTTPSDYANKVNPVKPTADSQARAKKQYGWDCAMCHGDNGDGKGDVAAEQKLAMRDYRDPAALKSMSDGEIFYIIQKGKGQMPSEGDRAKPDEIWNLVIYLRRMANPSTTASAAPGQ
jgi:mono/diheme cytochrome c family protein